MRPLLRATALLAIVPPAFFAILPPAETAAQSFLGFRALGYPVTASDGRTVGVGNIGIGLADVELSVTDPAAPSRLLMPTVSASMQPTWGSFEVGDETGSANSTRFPLIAAGFPVARANGVATISLAGFMEQQWIGERTETVVLGEDQALVEDRFETNGGASVARVGWAQRFGRRMSVGVTAGAYVGQLEQFFDRSLDSLAVEGTVRPYTETSRWRYSGYTFTAGFSADPHDLVHLAGALEWSGDIKENPHPGTEGGINSYSVPIRLSAGGTARLTPRLHLNGSVAYQDWSTATGFRDGVLSHLKFSYGGGVEWRAIQHDTRSFPVRMGFRRVVPPFRYQNSDPVETIFSLGVGLNLIEVEGIRFGWVDLAVERGSRSSHPLSEQFWRGTVSLGIMRF